MSGAHLLLKTLKALGIRHVCGIAGREAEFINFSEEKGIEFILTRHEFTAGIMAEVMGRVSKHPHVMWSTYGPGTTNAVTCAASAYLDRAPLVILSAQVERERIDPLHTHQCVDQLALMRPVTKYQVQLNTPEDIVQELPKAYAIANTEPRGPVHISIPLDVLGQESISARKQPISIQKGKTKLTLPPSKLLRESAKRIREAEHPLVVVGNEVLRTGSSGALINLAEHYQLPVITTIAGKGAFPEDHLLSVGTYTKYVTKLFDLDDISDFLARADLVLAVGYEEAEDTTPGMLEHWQHARGVEVTRVSSLPNTNTRWKPNHDLVGSLDVTLVKLIHGKKCETRVMPNVLRSIEHNVDEKKYDQSTLLQLRIASLIRKKIGPQGVLVSDVGVHRHIAGLGTRALKPDTFYCSSGLSTFGFALPAAMGVSCLDRKTPVVALCGDGGFHSVIQDLETCARLKLPVIIVVFKDNAFGLIQWYQKQGGLSHNTDMLTFEPVDFVQIARASGCRGERARTLKIFEQKFKAALSSKMPTVIEVPISYKRAVYE